jgi:hypothetical protein
MENNEFKKFDQGKEKFKTGAIRIIEGKEDYVETISYLALKRYAEYMTNKAKVYGRGNWRKGIPIESYEQSLMRHVQKYFANKYDNANLEPEEDHLSAILFNLQGLIHEEEKLKQNKENVMILNKTINDDRNKAYNKLLCVKYDLLSNKKPGTV